MRAIVARLGAALFLIAYLFWFAGAGLWARLVSFRTARKASVKPWAGLAESENNDGLGEASAADAGFVTGVSGSGENVRLEQRFPENSLS